MTGIEFIGRLLTERKWTLATSCEYRLKIFKDVSEYSSYTNAQEIELKLIDEL